MNMINVVLRIGELDGIVTKGEIIKALNLNKDNAYYYLRKLKELGILIDAGKRGVFIVNMHGSGNLNVHPYTMIDFVASPSAVAYWSALDYYGWSNRSPNIVYIQTPARNAYHNVVNYGNMKVVKISNFYFKPVNVKPEKFFGFTEAMINGKKVLITDMEKTLIDCLDKPKYAGTMEELFDALENAEFDKEKLIGYLRKFNNKAVIKRLGFVSELFGWDMENVLFAMLSRKDRRSYSLLDPNGPNTGEFNYKWGLRINVPDSYWRDTKWT